MSLPSLQDEVAKQDEMIKTIGLNRTEAFQIIDTQVEVEMKLMLESYGRTG
jgi:hypothetical protein